MNAIISDGGPAFPVPYSNEADGPTIMPTLGLSLRDYFAAKALPACIQVCVNDDPRHGTYHEHCAEQAYKMADAMLKAKAA